MRIFATTSGTPLKICFEYSNTRKQDLKMFVLKWIEQSFHFFSYPLSLSYFDETI